MNRLGTVVCSCVGILGLVAPPGSGSHPRLVYNASDSAPPGFYVVHQVAKLRLGDYVIAGLPDHIAKLAATRGYLPIGVPILKEIVAMAGQYVCHHDGWLYVDRIAVARTLSEDGRHRALSRWNGCRTLLDGELFLLNAGNPASFDSRYFGPLDVSFVRGRVTRL